MSDPDLIGTEPSLNVLTSRFFLDWLFDQDLSRAFTTYQTEKLFFEGRRAGPAISTWLAHFPDGEVWPASIRVAERLGYVAESLRDSDSEYPGIDGFNKVERGYDVACLSRVRQPMAFGFKTKESERLLLVDERGHCRFRVKPRGLNHETSRLAV